MCECQIECIRTHFASDINPIYIYKICLVVILSVELYQIIVNVQKLTQSCTPIEEQLFGIVKITIIIENSLKTIFKIKTLRNIFTKYQPLIY